MTVQTITLQTRAGEYVGTAHLNMTMFVPPEVIMWHTRVFVRQPGGHYTETVPIIPDRVDNAPLS